MKKKGRTGLLMRRFVAGNFGFSDEKRSGRLTRARIFYYAVGGKINRENAARCGENHKKSPLRKNHA
jgi:hypothetical protein